MNDLNLEEQNRNDRQRQAELLAQHASLMNKGFPPKQTQEFWCSVAMLPSDVQKHLHKLMETAQLARQSIRGRG